MKCKTFVQLALLSAVCLLCGCISSWNYPPEAYETGYYTGPRVICYDANGYVRYYRVYHAPYGGYCQREIIPLPQVMVLPPDLQSQQPIVMPPPVPQVRGHCHVEYMVVTRPDGGWEQIPVYVPDP